MLVLPERIACPWLKNRLVRNSVPTGRRIKLCGSTGSRSRKYYLPGSGICNRCSKSTQFLWCEKTLRKYSVKIRFERMKSNKEKKQTSIYCRETQLCCTSIVYVHVGLSSRMMKNVLHWSTNLLTVSAWCQDGSRTITEVKHLELNQFLDG